MKRTSVVVALLALIGAFAPAIADPVRTPCQADDAIPEFVTRRIELVSAVPAGGMRPRSSWSGTRSAAGGSAPSPKTFRVAVPAGTRCATGCRILARQLLEQWRPA